VEHRKTFKVAILFLFLILSTLLSGCNSKSPEENQNTDSRFIGQWKNQRTSEILEFKDDGTYTITEKEEADWYTEPGGTIWMDGTAYSYSFSENDTVLSLTESGYTRIYQKL
jgi:hypothetical protein